MPTEGQLKRAEALSKIKTIYDNKPGPGNGLVYTEVRKVSWDELWHLYYETHKGDLNYDRVDKKRALYIVDRI